MKGILPATDSFAWPTITMQPDKIVALTKSLMDTGVGYKLGAKVEPLSLQAGDFHFVDCSGFVRWAICHVTDEVVIVPDGSFNQHDWVKQQGFKESSFEDAKNSDGIIRIAFLSPSQGDGGIGHVMLIVDGYTCESHGSHGPDRREWGSCGFMSECSVYVLTAPQ